MIHSMEIKIYYEDTDCGGVVYYATYLRYMERARTEYMASRGSPVKTLMDEGTVFMVARVEIDYRSPARYGDTLIVDTWVSDSSAATILFEHTMKEKTSSRLIAGANARLVCVDPTGKPKRIPKELADKLK